MSGNVLKGEFNVTFAKIKFAIKAFYAAFEIMTWYCIYILSGFTYVPHLPSHLG